MRLTPTEITHIKSAVQAVDAQADVYLYGSRVDDGKRGGDIDLLVISNEIDFYEKIDIISRLVDKLGDQKIDLLVESDFNTSFTRHIKKRL